MANTKKKPSDGAAKKQAPAAKPAPKKKKGK